MRYLLLMVLLFIPIIVSAQSCKSQPPFTLQTAVTYALTHSPDLDSQWRNLKIGQLKLKNIQAKFLPSVDATSNHDLQNSSSSATSGVKLEATENIFNNGEDFINTKISKLQLLNDQLTYFDARDKLINSIVNDFLDFSLQDLLFALEQKRLRLLQEQYKLALDKYHQGLRTQLDVERFRSSVQTTKIQALSAKKDSEQTQQKLLMELGIFANSNFCNVPSFKSIALAEINTPSYHFVTPDLKQLFAYKILTIQHQIKKLQVTLARNKLLPQVNIKADANYGNNNQNGIVSSFGRGKQLGWHAGIEAKYNLFDAGTKRRELEIERANTLSALDKQTQLLLQDKRTLNNFMLDLQQHNSSYQISKDLAAAELKQFHAIEKKYRDGNIAYLDLINALDTLLSAQRQQLSDRYNLEKDFYSYQYYRGKIYDAVFK